jgi:hypothetical protein
MEKIILLLHLVQWFFVSLADLVKKIVCKKRIEREKKMIKDNREKKPFSDFILSNKKQWQTTSREKERPRVLIEGIITYPKYLVMNLIIGRYLMNILGSKGTMLLKEPDNDIENLARSYGIDSFIYLEKPGFATRIKNIWQSVRIFSGMDGIDDLLRLKYKGISLGKIVYDDCLRKTGNGTFGEKSWIFLKGIKEALDIYESMENEGSYQFIEYFVQTEMQFLPSGIICQWALTKGIKIYVRGGAPDIFTLRLYEDINQAYLNIHRPDSDLFKYIKTTFLDMAIKEGKSFIESRISGKPRIGDLDDAFKAYDDSQKVLTRREMCDRYGWDESKPIAGVFSNMLTDGVFTNEWSLYRDNLLWLRETIKIAANIKDVNWIIKAHPSDEKNDVKGGILKEYHKYASKSSNIIMLPENIGSKTLVQIIDCAITAHGNVCIEYSVLGKPSIIGGQALYSGFGFALEPETVDEYEQYLRDIRHMATIEDDKIVNASIFAYIHLCLSRVKCSLLPNFRLLEDHEFWVELKSLIETEEPAKDRLFLMMEKQIKNGYRHLLNYDWINM